MTLASVVFSVFTLIWAFLHIPLFWTFESILFSSDEFLLSSYSSGCRSRGASGAGPSVDHLCRQTGRWLDRGPVSGPVVAAAGGPARKLDHF